MYFVTVFLFLIEEFILNIYPEFLGKCFSRSLLNLDIYFTGFV